MCQRAYFVSIYQAPLGLGEFTPSGFVMPDFTIHPDHRDPLLFELLRPVWERSIPPF